VRKSILLLFAGILFSCASANTQFIGFKSPSYSGGKLTNIMVFVAVDDWILREQAEKTIAGKFSSNKASAISSFRLFSPLETYNNEQIDSVLNKAKIGGILILSLDDLESSTYGFETAQYYSFFNTIQKNSTSGTYSIQTAKVTSSLFDVETGKQVWLGKSSTTGNSYSNKETYINSIAEELYRNLKQNKLVN